MGGYSSKDLQIEKLQGVSIDKLWRKHTETDQMNPNEFRNFLITISNMLGTRINQAEISAIFNSLQKSGKVFYLTFDSQFDTWYSKQVQEHYGSEVLKPTVPLTPITKTYQLTVPSQRTIYKKLEFKNPHDYVKDLKIDSSNEKVLVIRNPRN